MENKLFRKKSLERISSPEQLHDYMRVTSPRLWMILAAIVILLTGFIAYASTASMENTMPIKVQADNIDSFREEENGEIVSEPATVFRASLPKSYKDVVETGMRLRMGNEEGTIGMIAMIDSEEGDEEMLLIIDMDNDRLHLPDGEYDADLVLETTTPVSFLWN